MSSKSMQCSFIHSVRQFLFCVESTYKKQRIVELAPCIYRTTMTCQSLASYSVNKNRRFGSWCWEIPFPPHPTHLSDCCTHTYKPTHSMMKTQVTSIIKRCGMCCKNSKKHTSLRPRQDRNTTRMVSSVTLQHPFTCSSSRSSRLERAANPVLAWKIVKQTPKAPHTVCTSHVLTCETTYMHLLDIQAHTWHAPHAPFSATPTHIHLHLTLLTCIRQLLYTLKVKFTDVRTSLDKLLDAVVCSRIFAVCVTSRCAWGCWAFNA